jgi:glycosyltransferase involved in cell wall biosynthesis
MTGQATRLRFSIVSAIYNVEAYLPEFIASIEAQDVEPGWLEVVAVDDGSTDGSLDILRRWAASSRFRVKVFTKPNGGQGSARNLGIDHAEGEWVTFSDPDDRLGPGFLRVADQFAREHPEIQIMAGKHLMHLEAAGQVRDSHPRRHQFAAGNRVADMEMEPNSFPGSTNTSFYRLDRLHSTGLRFDDRLRPNFEDGHFAAQYLLSLPNSEVGLLRDAVYYYRKRADQSSTLQQSLRDPRRFTTVLELGYLDILERARKARGEVPEWLQHLLIYELYWYLAEDEKVSSGAYIPPELVERFHQLLRQILGHLDPDVVGRHTVLRLGSILVDLFSRAGRSEAWHSPYVVRTKHDPAQQLQRLSYRFVGPRPREEFSLAGREIPVAFAKTMAHRYYGRDLLYERILWVPAGRLEVRLDGEAVPVRRKWPKIRRRGRRPNRRRSLPRRVLAYRHLPLQEIQRRIAKRRRRIVQRVRGSILRRIAAGPPFRGRFERSWLVMDRVHDADDNGERLFEYLRSDRPDINAWFAIERDTPDWHRMRAVYGRRVLAHGSFAWKMAMLNCDWVISSHVDQPVYRPAQLAGTGRASWKFAFVEHGIIKDDLSVWLNRKELDMFVVSTEAELESVAGNGTAYRFTPKETRNTGLPRFDRLLRKGREVPAAERNLVIVAPTWRQWLARSLSTSSQRRELESSFWDSDYFRNWTELLRSTRIADALATRGWRLGFMPHPNMQAMLPELDLPAHVEPLSFAGTDVQGLYGRCALLVTDYSSVAFNAAYLDRPLVYFQFDRERMLGGAHVGRQGYFDYGRDGYGPVVEDLAAAEEAVVASIERGAVPAPMYQARIQAAFPARDGGACARVVAVIEELSRPWEGPTWDGQAAEVDSEGP